MASPSNMKASKGWFLGIGRDGDRTLDQQMIGLDRLISEVSGKTVLDAGCAEGLISIALVRAGATSTVGLEVVAGHIEFARELSVGLPCEWHVANLNEFDCAGLPATDVVLMLAVLHKLKDPSRVCAALASRATDLCIIRLPPSGPVIIDARSNNKPHDIRAVMDAAGFDLEHVEASVLAEWLGYFRRRKQKNEAPVETKPAEVETKQDKPDTEVVESATAAADVGTKVDAEETRQAEPEPHQVAAGTIPETLGADVPGAAVDQDGPKVTEEPDSGSRSSRRRRGLGSMFKK